MLENQCNLCGKELEEVNIHSGDGREELCYECYHDMYDSDEEDE